MTALCELSGSFHAQVALGELSKKVQTSLLKLATKNKGDIENTKVSFAKAAESLNNLFKDQEISEFSVAHFYQQQIPVPVATAPVE